MSMPDAIRSRRRRRGALLPWAMPAAILVLDAGFGGDGSLLTLAVAVAPSDGWQLLVPSPGQGSHLLPMLAEALARLREGLL